MPFLLTNQQRQSTEGRCEKKQQVKKNILSHIHQTLTETGLFVCSLMSYQQIGSNVNVFIYKLLWISLFTPYLKV